MRPRAIATRPRGPGPLSVAGQSASRHAPRVPPCLLARAAQNDGTPDRATTWRNDSTAETMRPRLAGTSVLPSATGVPPRAVVVSTSVTPPAPRRPPVHNPPSGFVGAVFAA